MQHPFSIATVLSLSLLSITALYSQERTAHNPVTIPSGTPIYVQLDRNYPLRAGQTVQAHVAYPVYVGHRSRSPQARWWTVTSIRCIQPCGIDELRDGTETSLPCASRMLSSISSRRRTEKPCAYRR